MSGLRPGPLRLAVLLALAPALAGVRAQAQTELGPLALVRPAGGPEVLLREQPESPLVAVRLAVPVREPPGLEGAARLLQHLGWERASPLASHHGAQLELVRTPTHAVYTVVGPADMLEELVGILHVATGAPAGGAREIEAARRAVEARALAELETPEPLVLGRLRERLFPSSSGPIGGAGALTGLTPARLRSFWSRTYRPNRMVAVVAGAVREREVSAAFRSWPAPPVAGRPDAPPRTTATAPAPQVIGAWVGLGYDAARIDPATLAVIAALTERRLAALPLARRRAEVWRHGDQQALVLLGARRGQPDGAARGAGRGGAAGSLAQQLELALADAGGQLTPAEVVQLRRALRRDLLFAARTPQGMAAVLGGFWERTGDPEAASRYLEALDRVEPERVRRAIVTLVASAPAVVEVKP